MSFLSYDSNVKDMNSNVQSLLYIEIIHIMFEKVNYIIDKP